MISKISGWVGVACLGSPLYGREPNRVWLEPSVGHFHESGLTEKRRSSAAYELRFPVSIGP